MFQKSLIVSIAIVLCSIAFGEDEVHVRWVDYRSAQDTIIDVLNTRQDSVIFDHELPGSSLLMVWSRRTEQLWIFLDGVRVSDLTVTMDESDNVLVYAGHYVDGSPTIDGLLTVDIYGQVVVEFSETGFDGIKATVIDDSSADPFALTTCRCSGTGTKRSCR